MKKVIQANKQKIKWFSFTSFDFGQCDDSYSRNTP